MLKKVSRKRRIYGKSATAGTYRVSFKKAGYVEQQVTTYINEGDLTVIDIALVGNGD